MVNSMSGTESKYPNQNPGQKRRNDNERGRNRTPKGRDSNKRSKGRKSRESRNTRHCFNCDKVTTHFANTCPEPRRKEGKVEGKFNNPIPKFRNHVKRQGRSKPRKRDPQDKHADHGVRSH